MKEKPGGQWPEKTIADNRPRWCNFFSVNSFQYPALPEIGC
jgi:hypothetical protein